MPDLILFEDISHLFEEFEHTAWRLETQCGYASDRRSPKWQRWQAGELLGYNPVHPWHANIRAQTDRGSASSGRGSWTTRLRKGSSSCSPPA